MAEEMDDLDGLEDFGSESDFGDELGDFMDSDMGEEGGVDGDSELDSFFEDLSTIDDLEVKEEAEEEEPAAEEPGEGEPEPEPEMEEPVEEEPEEKERKPILIPVIISLVIGLVIGAIAWGVLYFLYRPVEVEMPPVETTSLTTTTYLQPPPVMQYTAPSTTLPPAPPPLPEKQINYFVQVANCIYQECVDDYRFLLKRHGYRAKVITRTDKTPMTEIISRKTYGEEAASKWVNSINNENYLTGKAYRKRVGKRYKISLGLFPDLDTANRVKMHLNQMYTARIIFDAKKVEKTIKYHKILAGGLESREDAEKLKKTLIKKDRRYKGAFVIQKLQ